MVRLVRWSAKHDWVSRSAAREEWILSTSDEQIVVNKLACDLAIVTRADARKGSTAKPLPRIRLTPRLASMAD